MPAPSASLSAADLATRVHAALQRTLRLIAGAPLIWQYRRRDLPHDVIAGLTVAAVIVPIGMA